MHLFGIIFAVTLGFAVSTAQAVPILKCRPPSFEISVSYTYLPGQFKIGGPACCSNEFAFPVVSREDSKKCAESRGVLFEKGGRKLCCSRPSRAL
jgi:hypothetical protein